MVRDPVRGGWATPDLVHGHQAPFYPIRLQQPVRVALDAAPVRAATAALDAATMGGALRARLEQRAAAIAVCEDAEEQQVNLGAPAVPDEVEIAKKT
ncbi:uncharacterized protein [Miscanthus floridulus]|uniref:uncharacterized protein isoform X4 n=1 Tax=Miscanthus floridulus TaxID=154761 RepID=UPI00345AA26E